MTRLEWARALLERPWQHEDFYRLGEVLPRLVAVARAVQDQDGEPQMLEALAWLNGELD